MRKKLIKQHIENQRIGGAKLDRLFILPAGPAAASGRRPRRVLAPRPSAAGPRSSSVRRRAAAPVEKMFT